MTHILCLFGIHAWHPTVALFERTRLTKLGNCPLWTSIVTKGTTAGMRRAWVGGPSSVEFSGKHCPARGVGHKTYSFSDRWVAVRWSIGGLLRGLLRLSLTQTESRYLVTGDRT